MYALFSVKPCYAEALLSGNKRFELRRRRPHVAAGTRVFLYATFPQAKVVGVGVVRQVLATYVESLWDMVQDSAAIEQSAFNEYFKGCDYGYALEFEQVIPLDNELPLSELRAHCPGYQPPQFYHRIHPSHDLYGFLIEALPESATTQAEGDAGGAWEILGNQDAHGNAQPTMGFDGDD